MSVNLVPISILRNIIHRITTIKELCVIILKAVGRERRNGTSPAKLSTHKELHMVRKASKQ